MAETELRALIRERLQSAVIPRAPADKTFGGFGDGKPCDCCGEDIAQDQFRFNVEFASGCRLTAHRACLELWMDESLAPYQDAAELRRGPRRTWRRPA